MINAVNDERLKLIIRGSDTKDTKLILSTPSLQSFGKWRNNFGSAHGLPSELFVILVVVSMTVLDRSCWATSGIYRIRGNRKWCNMLALISSRQLKCYWSPRSYLILLLSKVAAPKIVQSIIIWQRVLLYILFCWFVYWHVLLLQLKPKFVEKKDRNIFNFF